MGVVGCTGLLGSLAGIISPYAVNRNPESAWNVASLFRARPSVSASASRCLLGRAGLALASPYWLPAASWRGAREFVVEYEAVERSAVVADWKEAVVGEYGAGGRVGSARPYTVGLALDGVPGREEANEECEG